MDEWDDFTLETMTAAINSHGFVPGQLGQLGNVHRDEDASENVKLNKKKSSGRIDAAVAAIMALGRAEAGEQKRKAREVEVV